MAFVRSGGVALIGSRIVGTASAATVEYATNILAATATTKATATTATSCVCHTLSTATATKSTTTQIGCIATK